MTRTDMTLKVPAHAAMWDIAQMIRQRCSRGQRTESGHGPSRRRTKSRAARPRRPGAACPVLRRPCGARGRCDRLSAGAALGGGAGAARRAPASHRGRRRRLQHRAGGDPGPAAAPRRAAGAGRPRLCLARFDAAGFPRRRFDGPHVRHHRGRAVGFAAVGAAEIDLSALCRGRGARPEQPRHAGVPRRHPVPGRGSALRSGVAGPLHGALQPQPRRTDHGHVPVRAARRRRRPHLPLSRATGWPTGRPCSAAPNG